ncbi:MAG: HAMP domain-containing sensor histidine kinase [Candidatus Melainabacteria bacterium]|nr:HAMP domain-containing sensor histidine kinase [Candidatus Melainabacteria bacterium]
MKVKFSLYAQVVALLTCHLLALGLAIGLFLNSRFGGWEAILNSPVGDRADQVAGTISNQLQTALPEKWDGILNDFGRLYNVKYTVFDFGGNQLAGDKIALPAEVKNKFFPPPPPLPPDFKMGTFTHKLPPMPGQPFGFGAGPQTIALGSGPNFAPRPHFEPGLKFNPEHGPPPRGDFKFKFFVPGHPIGVHGRSVAHVKAPGDNSYWIGERSLFKTKEGNFLPGMILARMENPWTSSLIVDFKILGSVLAGIIILSILFWLPFVHMITRELTRLTKATEEMASGKFNIKIDNKRNDEIGRLTEAVNTMAYRLNGFVEGQKGFLGAISHELFSPLARLGLSLELLDGSSTEEQKRHIADIQEEVNEMNQLINELLAYAKAGMNETKVELSKVDLSQVIENLKSKLSLQDNLKVSLSEPCYVLAEPLLLERAISNILRNSIRYAGQTSPIEVIASNLPESNELQLQILDNGPGVPQEAITRLGEPFYRPESSRSRESGGVGLGLAIVKTCIEACEGKFAIANRKEGGLQVTIILKTG